MMRNLRERFLGSDFPAARNVETDKIRYARPGFLQLYTADELRASADHNVRPIIVPRDIGIMPWHAGYAECVNSGKSEWNEDQAEFSRFVLSDPTHKYPDLPYTYFGIFDGHAGFGAALAASHQLHHILFEKFVDCLDMLLHQDFVDTPQREAPPLEEHSFLNPRHFERPVTKDELIVGALESAFFSMDSLLDQERSYYRNPGGCTSCVAVFINGKLFVANAGDSRAILCLKKPPADTKKPPGEEGGGGVQDDEAAAGCYAQPMSFDHTPETEKMRLLNIAQLKPELMGRNYSAIEYAKRPRRKDMGKRVLCRSGTNVGWTYKTVTMDDVTLPVVSGEGKRSRLLGTLGVTRGFGDFELRDIHAGMRIKPFLTPQPEVRCRDLTKIVSIPDEHNEDGDYGILVMATDGLWDVTDNDTVARTVFKTLAKYPTEKHRYTMAAQELVARARGKVNESGHWRLGDSKAAATVDDISVIVIPVYPYYKEHVEWTRKCQEKYQRQPSEAPTVASEALEANETITVTLVNGVSKAQLGLGDGGGVDEDDDEEEIVVEVNRSEKAQAIIEEENEEEEEEKPSVTAATPATLPPSEKKSDDQQPTDPLTKATESLANVRLAGESAAVASAADEPPQTPASPDKVNKTNPQQPPPPHQQQQKRQRNRKDKR